MLISEDLISIRSHIPSEFARKPRSLKEVAMWKATEHKTIFAIHWHGGTACKSEFGYLQ